MLDFSSPMDSVYLIIDAETARVSGERESAVRRVLEQTTKPAANIKDPMKMILNVFEKIETAIDKSSLDPNLGELSMIGVRCINENKGTVDTILFTRWDAGSEAKMLADFFDWLRELSAKAIITMCGKGLKRFDFPMIKVRAIVNRVDGWLLLPKTRDYSTAIFDLEDTDIWPGAGRDYMPSLDDIALALGIEVENPGSGKDMPAAFAEGNFGLIEDHNVSDLKTTHAVLVRLGLIPEFETANTVEDLNVT